MFRYTCLNPIAQTGLDGFSENYQKTEELNDADAILVRSAKMHEMELPKSVCAIARAGAGVNNIPLGKYADQGIVVFNTPGQVDVQAVGQLTDGNGNAAGTKVVAALDLIVDIAERIGRQGEVYFLGMAAQDGDGGILLHLGIARYQPVDGLCY